MKRKSCVSAFSRRLSEADIRNRITRNTPAKPLHNLSSTKNNPKTATSELRKDPTIIIGYKLNNFTTQNKQLFTSKTCKNFMNQKPNTATIRKRPSTFKVHEEEENEPQQALLRWSKKMVKVIWTQNDHNLPYLVLSIDFLADQDGFWQKPTIPVSSLKIYKWLHKNFFVIWIIRVQRMFLSLKEFVEIHNLPLNSVFYVKPSRSYTVDYSKIMKLINKHPCSHNPRILAIEVIKINAKDLCTKDTFWGKVPVAQSGPTSNISNIFHVIMSRVEQFPAGMEFLMQILKNWENRTDKITIMNSLPIFIEEYYVNDVLEEQRARIICKKQILQKRSKTSQRTHQEEPDWQANEEIVDQKISQFKRKMVDQIIREKGRNFQYEGNSVYYIVGDIIKRNYNFLYELNMRSLTDELEDHKKTGKDTKMQKEPNRNEKGLKASIDQLNLRHYNFYQFLA